MKLKEFLTQMQEQYVILNADSEKLELIDGSAGVNSIISKHFKTTKELIDFLANEIPKTKDVSVLYFFPIYEKPDNRKKCYIILLKVKEPETYFLIAKYPRDKMRVILLLVTRMDAKVLETLDEIVRAIAQSDLVDTMSVGARQELVYTAGVVRAALKSNTPITRALAGRDIIGRWYVSYIKDALKGEQP